MGEPRAELAVNSSVSACLRRGLGLVGKEFTCMYRGASRRKHLPQRGCVELGSQVHCKCASERGFMPSDVDRGMSLRGLTSEDIQMRYDIHVSMLCFGTVSGALGGLSTVRRIEYLTGHL